MYKLYYKKKKNLFSLINLETYIYIYNVKFDNVSEEFAGLFNYTETIERGLYKLVSNKVKMGKGGRISI